MGLFSRLERRSQPIEERKWVDVSASFGQDPARVKSQSIDTMLGVPAVYTCTSIIANTISTLPVDVFSKSEGTTKQAKAHPGWLTQPNTDMLPAEFWGRVVVSLLLHGNAYIFVTRDDKGTPLELFPLHPATVNVEYNAITGKKTFTVNDATISPLDIIHIPGLSVPGSPTGVSPVSAARIAMEQSLSAEKVGADMYSNGLSIQGIIESSKTMAPQETERLRREFSNKHRGKDAYAIGVLTGGATFKTVTMPLKDAQFIETKKFSATQIAGMYQVPAYLLDPSVTSTWGTGIQEQNTQFVQKTLVPWIVRIEQAVNAKLLSGNQYLKFNVNALMRGSFTERVEAYRSGILFGWLTRAEARDLEDLPQIDGLDKPLVMLNMETLESSDVRLEKLKLEAEQIKQAQSGSN